jgi:hypothetical protein
MKYILLTGILASQLAMAECNVRISSVNQNQQQVGPVTNLEKRIVGGKCSVKFQMVVDGETHSVTGESQGMDVEHELCNNAVINARKTLLVNLGGTFKSDTLTKCTDGKATIKEKVSIGDTILETEVGPSPIKKYFKHKGAKCRMFQDNYEVNRRLVTYNGVICQIDNSDTNWLVVDKW